MKLGDVLTHRASEKNMVVVHITLDFPQVVKCRYHNSITGFYESAEFLKIEFKQYPEIGD